MNRASGVLMHVSSLPGEYSIGNFGKEAFGFIDFLKECGFKYWQVLPFGMVDDCNSPYKSYSAFGKNPFFIDPETLYEKGLISAMELEQSRQSTPYSAEFDRLRTERMELLFKASKRVTDRAPIEHYLNENQYIKQCCEFMSLKDSNGGREWIDWTVKTYDPDRYFMWCFIQYEFIEEWRKVKRYANLNGIKIIGDIPIYVSYDSCDVWGNKEQFLLDKDHKPSAVAGVPPDYFSKNGQLWGNPLYDWGKMKADNFSWWKARLNSAFEMFDGVRIDHFRGIESFWSVPANAKTAKEGKWVKGPGKAFVDAVNSIKGEKIIIAEDLGDITKEVVELVKYSGFPGMRVFQFGFMNFGDNPHKPHNYPSNCVAYTGTHDNNTLLGYVWELEMDKKLEMLKYCGFNGDNWDNCYDDIIRVMLCSHADTVIFPIQDILRFGKDTRLNVPGEAKGNWSYRLTLDQLKTIDCKKYNELNKRYGR